MNPCKADIFNKQYASVFTEEVTTSVPDLGPSPHPQMSHPYITEKGVQKLLHNLNPNKAVGPDKISPAFLQEISAELAPLFARLFQKSLDEGYVPKQWRTADISPVFKKGQRYMSQPTTALYPSHQSPPNASSTSWQKLLCHTWKGITFSQTHNTDSEPGGHVRPKS